LAIGLRFVGIKALALDLKVYHQLLLKLNFY